MIDHAPPVANSGRRELPSLSLEIAAQPGLVHQLISAVGQSGGDHGSRLLEQVGPDRMIVEFTTRALGRVVRTQEEVVLTPPVGIHYRLLRGPLPEVEEDFTLEPREGGCTLRYSGWFKPNRGLRGWFDRVAVPRLYRRAVWSSMQHVKLASEARQRKSRVFPQP